METQLHSLSKIFTERLFRIPDYQRGYAWGDRQLKDFWNDIQQIEEGKNHYTGVLTLEEADSSIVKAWHEDRWIVEAKSFMPFYVVDGQQRLTTSIILIQCIIEALGDDDKLNYTSKSEIQKKFIFDSKDGGISRSYIFGYEKDNPSYEYLKTKIFEERSSSSLDSKETIYTNNLEVAKKFFSEQLNELKLADLETLYKNLTQHLLFNIFSIEEEVDVCVAFETMNNRGKPLSYLELLKNRLIFLSLKMDCDPEDQLALRRAINDCWKSIYHQLGRNKDQPLDDDHFLHNHFVIYFGQDFYNEEEIERPIHRRRIFRADYASYLLERKFITKNVKQPSENKEKITISDINSYVRSLQTSVESWYKIFSPFDSDFSSDVQIWLDKLNRMGIRWHAPLIMVFFEKEKRSEKRVDFLKAVERHVFILMFLGHRNHLHIDHFHFVELATSLSSGRADIDKTVKSVLDWTKSIESESEFIKRAKSSFRQEGFYKWASIRYFLFEYNLHLQENSKTQRKKIHWPEFVEERTDFISVEHIYPQRARHAYWIDRFNSHSANERRALRESLGNLLPLSTPKNSSLQNLPFPDKVDRDSKKSVGFRFGCYAENEVAREGDWSPINIMERGLKLLDFLEVRWNLRLGNKNGKISILGLQFMNRKSLTSAEENTKHNKAIERTAKRRRSS